jgi:hypothetical protein
MMEFLFCEKPGKDYFPAETQRRRERQFLEWVWE